MPSLLSPLNALDMLAFVSSQVALYDEANHKTIQFIETNLHLTSEQFLRNFFLLPAQQVRYSRNVIWQSKLNHEMRYWLQHMVSDACYIAQPHILAEQVHVKLRGLQQYKPVYADIFLDYIRRNHSQVYDTVRDLLAEHTARWIETALSLDIRLVDILSAIDRTQYKQVLERFLQITPFMQANFEKNHVSAKIIFKLAIKIEHLRINLPRHNSYISGQEYPRDLHVNIDQRKIYIIPRLPEACFQQQGGYREVTNALEIGIDRYTIKSVKAVVHGCNKPQINTTDLKMIKQEVAILNTLRKLPNIIQIRSIADRKMDILNAQDQACPSIIMDRLCSDGLEKLFLNENPVSTKLQKIYEIICIVLRLHQAHIFHGDLKVANFLTTAQDKLIIIDFNSTLELQPENIVAWRANKKGICHSMLLDYHLYSASWYTPPDLLVADSTYSGPQTSEDYEKIEAYVIGCMLINLLEKNFAPLPWIEFIGNKAKSESIPELSYEQRQDILQQHKEHIEDKIITINQNPPKEGDVAQHVFYMLLNLMRRNATERWSLQQAKDYLEQHFICLIKKN